MLELRLTQIRKRVLGVKDKEMRNAVSHFSCEIILLSLHIDYYNTGIPYWVSYSIM